MINNVNEYSEEDDEIQMSGRHKNPIKNNPNRSTAQKSVKSGWPQTKMNKKSRFTAPSEFQTPQNRQTGNQGGCQSMGSGENAPQEVIE